MENLRGDCRVSVVAATAAVLVACGGATASSGGGDSGPKATDTGARQPTEGGRGRRDAASTIDAPGTTDAPRTTDAPGTTDAASGADASEAGTRADSSHHRLDAGGLCLMPVFDGGSTVGGCGDAHCPMGTVCIQIDEDVTSQAKCVSVPAACGGTPTCACMGAEALACGRPGTRFLDAGIGPGTCQDEGEAGGTYLDLPCGCA